ncbi:MAG TPA: fumarylacetoacetate hydrolase family protein, partial [Acidimicrobiales bacterium]|nr:fumarylacetoacetate hydrolase family protein [Acidimicrobiales bacterium]
PTASFVKLPGSVCGHLAAVELPDGCFVDYEGEIAVVIGMPARDVAPDEVDRVVAGLCLANDVSCRDAPTTHLVLAKGAPGFCPLGPALVTLDEVRLDDVAYTVSVNGEERQRAHTRDMVHPVRAVVSSYSRALPLRPGDVILTGSPGGVGIALDPPRALQPGDTVEVASPQLGRLANTFVAGVTGDEAAHRRTAAPTST